MMSQSSDGAHLQSVLCLTSAGHFMNCSTIKRNNKPDFLGGGLQEILLPARLRRR